jgi:hypothetical protein
MAEPAAPPSAGLKPSSGDVTLVPSASFDTHQ